MPHVSGLTEDFQLSMAVNLFTGGNEVPVLASQGTPNTDLRLQLQLRVHAEEHYRRTQAFQKVTRAMNSKPQKVAYFIPGDLVYYRRYKTPAQLPSNVSLDQPKVGLARWYGPARVLSTETRNEDDGTIRRAGHVIWIVAGGRLKRCSPSQLRHASEKEKLVAEASHGSVTMPWSFTSLLQCLEKGQFDTYDDEAFEEGHPRQSPVASSFQPRTPGRSRSRARSAVEPRRRHVSGEEGRKEEQRRPEQDPLKGQDRKRPKEAAQEGVPAPRSRSTSQEEEKRMRKAPSKIGRFEAAKYLVDPTYDPFSEIPPVSRPSSNRPDCLASPGASRSSSHGNDVANAMVVQEEDGGDESLILCVYEMPLPQDTRDKKKFLRDSAAWVVQKMKKGSEMKVSQMTPEQLESFKAAKKTEVQNWIREQAVRGVSHYVPRERIMRMRWVLTLKDDGRAKARIVILGFEDPDLTDLSRSSPTMTRRTRQLIMTFATVKRWRMLKGDIKSAFLQGLSSEESRQIYAYPLPELAEAIHAPVEQPVQILKAAYGLVNAPSEWHTSVCNAMQSAGFEKLHTEPCAWRLREWNEELQRKEVVGLVAAHVDDFLFCGDDQSTTWQNAVSNVYQKFLWSPWELDDFSHSGVKIRQNPECDFVLDHSDFCTGLEQITVGADRNDKEKATDDEKAQLRGLLGSAQWRAYQTGLQHASRLSMLQSEMASATVSTLRMANKLCREIYASRHISVKINHLEVRNPEEVVFVAWSDAALGNRPNGGSTGGYYIAAAGPILLEGKATNINGISWRSGKLQRVARSSLAAEVQAFSEAEEELMFVHLQWAEMVGQDLPLRHPEECVKKIPGVMVTDAKSLFDVIGKGDKNSSGLGMKEKYSALEVLSLIQRLEMCDTKTRWVHSETQLADGLTKHIPNCSLVRTMIDGAWTLVEDPQFKSSKRLRREGRTENISMSNM